MHTFNGVLSYSCYFMISTKGCLNRKNEAVEVLEIDFNQATQVYEDLFTNELWNHINILSSDVVISELVDVAPVQTTIFFPDLSLQCCTSASGKRVNRSTRLSKL